MRGCLFLPSGGYRSRASTDDKIHLRSADLFLFLISDIGDKGLPLSTLRENITYVKAIPFGRHLVRELVSWYRRKRGNVPRNKFRRKNRFKRTTLSRCHTPFYIGHYKRGQWKINEVDGFDKATKEVNSISTTKFNSELKHF